MKKYAIIASIGTHGYENGRHVIDCTVKEVKFVTDGDSPFELMKRIVEETNNRIVYADNGKWYSLSMLKRVDAKYELARYGKT